MAAALIIRILIVIALFAAVVILRRPRRFSWPIIGLLCIGGFLFFATEIVSSKGYDDQRKLAEVTQQNEQRWRVRVVRVLALETYTAYHATSMQAVRAAESSLWLQDVASNEQLVWPPAVQSPTGSPREPLPLIVRRLRRALFELMPVFESDPQLLADVARYITTHDPNPDLPIAFQHVLRGDGRQLLELRMRWLQDVAIPAMRARLLELQQNPALSRVVELPPPGPVAVAPPGSGPDAIRTDVTSLPGMEEEASAIELRLVTRQPERTP